MTTKLGDQLAPLLSDKNVQAFFRVIREGESGQTDDAYRMMYGGELFESFADHPRKAIESPWGWTSAAGAYQFMCAVPGKVKTDTWSECVEALGLPDFSPASQDLACLFLIRRRKALMDVMSGAVSAAIRKCNREWASLPCSPYGQPRRTMEQALATFVRHGGSIVKPRGGGGPGEEPR